MDIFIINALDSKNIDKNLLHEFQKKEISDKKALEIHCFTYLMLDRILREVYKIENREIIFENKKPILLDGKKKFSISHSHDYIAIAFSDSNCGIDIEKNKPRNYMKISKRMNFKANTLDMFYQKWTEFEAIYKLNCEPKKKYYTKINDYSLFAVSNNPKENFELYIQK